MNSGIRQLFAIEMTGKMVQLSWINPIYKHWGPKVWNFIENVYLFSFKSGKQCLEILKLVVSFEPYVFGRHIYPKLVRLYSNDLCCQHVHWLRIEPMTLCELWEKEKLKIFHLISDINPCQSDCFADVIWKHFHLRFQAFRPCCV